MEYPLPARMRRTFRHCHVKLRFNKLPIQVNPQGSALSEVGDRDLEQTYRSWPIMGWSKDPFEGRGLSGYLLNFRSTSNSLDV